MLPTDKDVAMNLKDSVIAITGGASGLGKATARLLAEQGARVAVMDLNCQNGTTLVKELGEKAVFCQLDITDESSVRHALKIVKDTFGRVDGLVNSAGIGGRVKTIEPSNIDPEEWFDRQLKINLMGSYRMVRRTANIMKENCPNHEAERGVIINVSSVAALEGQIGHAAYGAAKGGVMSMTLPLARELAAYGIRIMTILPGIFDTPMTADWSDDLVDIGLRQIPFPRRRGRPEEFASLVAHIIENAYLNGESIRIDGGIRGGYAE